MRRDPRRSTFAVRRRTKYRMGTQGKIVQGVDLFHVLLQVVDFTGNNLDLKVKILAEI